ncbi:MAG: ABC-F family ATP-binding cassette domain-containing protein [Lachnospiraceae bacterium]|nr:ABC-F family ATP-binding cassette domain-containing protein [Lachnospiraceae bacterium]
MILSVNHLEKSFDGETLFSEASFRIDDKDKAAIVGSNGAGKTTLLRIIMGELSADAGEVVISRGKTIGYLSQHQGLSDDCSIYEEIRKAKADVLAMEDSIRALEQRMKGAEGAALSSMMEEYSRLNHEFELKDGYAARSEMTGVLKGMGFSEDEFDKRCGKLSGGQKTRVALAKLLLTRPDCILLDEPTNHLDISSIQWLEGYLRAYPGAVIVVAHDRYFLDRIADKVIEVDGGKVTEYKGNYSAYAALKKRQREDALKAYMNQRQMIRHQEEVIEKLRSFNREKSIKRAESRQKMLDKVKRLDKPAGPADKMVLKLSAHEESGKDVLVIEGLSKAFGDHTLFSDVNIHIRRGERVAIIGDNGTGKTTLLKIITGLADADAGTLTLGSKVEIGYYDQEQQLLTDENTLFEEISDAYPNLTNTTIRNTLASFLFTGDDVFKPVSALSGGERGRLALCKLILSDYNFLILDEPTNHLDMPSKEVLENALSSYEGTLLYVSHDRYFVNQTCTRILELSGEHFTEYLGNYDYYLEKKENMAKPDAASAGKAAQPETASAAGALDWKQQKEEQARKRKHENDIKKTEASIEKLETRSAEIDELLTQEEVFTNVSRLMELNSEKEKLQEELMELMEKWEQLLSEE